MHLVESQRGTAEQLAASQKRESLLTAQLAELQNLVTGQLQAGDNSELEQQVVEARRRASSLSEDRIQVGRLLYAQGLIRQRQLASELQDAKNKIAELEAKLQDNSELKEVQLENEALKRKVARAMQAAKVEEQSL